MEGTSFACGVLGLPAQQVARRTDAEPTALARTALRCGFLPLALRAAGVWIATHPRMSIEEFARHCAAEGGVLDLVGTGDEECLPAALDRVLPAGLLRP
ncbi:hypothetical protein [Streptomyces sp. NPDC019937]|uniref:hypothetical protein n=1 Tax=Streptomyces sp. NPDC019937 TaxID=3154787 RepID=UPI0033DDF9D0